MERSGSGLGLVVTDLALADLARQSGDRTEARRLAESGLERSEAIAGGPPQVRAMVLVALAVLDADDGEVERAGARIAEAAALPGANRDMPVMGHVALAAAYVALLNGDLGLAARTFGAALALRGTEERSDPQVVQLRRRLTEALGPDELDRLYGEGAALPRQQAMALLGGDATPTPADPEPPNQALRR
ncbi:MAG TPA: hypothetical protein VEL73_06405 [Mycobacteriales bacterium]|nr:hypothetical protein [Mycobacteriales bacterium]